MDLVVISPEDFRADEIDVVEALFAAGLVRYHVRKPRAGEAELAAWLERTPPGWRARCVLHDHHDLVDRFGLGGRHWRDDGRPITSPPASWRGFISRSCHDRAAVQAAAGVFDAVFYGPVFPSVSKPGYGPRSGGMDEGRRAMLPARSAAARRTAVLAIGGITARTAPQALALGFDGVAVLGAIWQASDPVGAFLELQRVVEGSSFAARGDRLMNSECRTSGAAIRV